MNKEEQDLEPKIDTDYINNLIDLRKKDLEDIKNKNRTFLNKELLDLIEGGIKREISYYERCLIDKDLNINKYKG